MRKILLFIILIFVFTGCSREKFLLEEDQCFVSYIDFRWGENWTMAGNHLYILDWKGNVIQDFPNTSISRALAPDGTIYNQVSGIYPLDTLFVLMRTNEDNSFNVLLYNLATDELISEPTGVIYYSISTDEEVHGMTINDKLYIVDNGFHLAPADYTTYDLQLGDHFWFFDSEADFLTIKNSADDVVNSMSTSGIAYPKSGCLGSLFNDEGYYYITSSDGTPYLDSNTFNKLNIQYNLPESLGVKVLECPTDDLMIIQSSYRAEDGFDLKYANYLCDMDGKVLFAELGYDTANYSDSWDHPDPDYIELFKTTEDLLEKYYYHIPSETIVELPSGYEKYYNRGNDFFLLINGNNCTIYDAQQKKVGITLHEEQFTSIYPIGLEHYVKPLSSQFSYDGKTYFAETEYATSIVNIYTKNNLTLVSIPTQNKRGCITMFFDRDGKLLKQIDQKILWFNDNYYITQLNDGFEIYSAEGTLLKTVGDTK